MVAGTVVVLIYLLALSIELPPMLRTKKYTEFWIYILTSLSSFIVYILWGKSC